MSRVDSLYQQITEKIVASVESGALPWRRPWTSLRPRNLKGRGYRGINRLVLGMAPHEDPRWATFNQVSALGGHVSKGERGTQIQLWLRDEDENGRERLVSRVYTVFNLEQCDGLDVPSLGRANSDRPLGIDAADAILKGYPDPPTLRYSPDRACYVSSIDEVLMPAPTAFEGLERFYGTLFHELIHSTGHPKRLARDGVTQMDGYGTERYAYEELIAEMGAAFLCSEAGIDADLDQPAAYVSSWLNALRRDSRMIVRAAGQAERACDWIVGRSPGIGARLEEADVSTG